MTGEVFLKKMRKAVLGGNPLDSIDVLREFVEEFQGKVLDAVNECCTNDTAHVIASVLENVSRGVRATTNDKRAICMEVLYKTAFKVESMHITVPREIKFD